MSLFRACHVWCYPSATQKIGRVGQENGPIFRVSCLTMIKKCRILQLEHAWVLLVDWWQNMCGDVIDTLAHTNDDVNNDRRTQIQSSGAKNAHMMDHIKFAQDLLASNPSHLLWLWRTMFAGRRKRVAGNWMTILFDETVYGHLVHLSANFDKNLITWSV